jgi:hypothetical protein
MAAEYDQQPPSRSLPHRTPHVDRQTNIEADIPKPRAGMGSLLANPSINGRGNGPMRAAAMRSLQQTYGNRALQRMLARQPRPSISRQATPSLSPALRQSTRSEATTSPVQRSRHTLTVQRQITDKNGNDYDFYGNPPDWLLDLSRADQREVLLENDLMTKIGLTEKYTKVLKRLGIALKEESVDDDGDGEYSEKKAKRTGKPNRLFEKVYKVPKLKRTGSGLGLVTMCEEPKCLKRSRELILEDNPANKRARYHERGYQDKHGKSRKPPLCHSTDHPAAWVLSALEDMINVSNGNGYGSATAYKVTKNYTDAKKTVEWDLPELKPGHTECNAKHKDKRWTNLSNSKQNKLKKEVFDHLEGKGLASGSWKNPTWL